MHEVQRTHACPRTCRYIHTLPYKHRNIHKYIHTYIHTYVRTCMSAYMLVGLRACLCLRPSIHPSIHPSLHTYLRTHMHKYIPTFMYTRSHHSIKVVLISYAFNRWQNDTPLLQYNKPF